MLQKLKSKSEGFTIIEVLIVLAIAGLIILIVFLAVPALQRNSRNTQRRNDTAGVASAVANFSNNTGGQLADRVAGDGTNTNNLVLSRNGVTGASETAKLGYYTTAVGATPATSSGNVFISTPGTLPTITNNPANPASATNLRNDSISIVVGWSCNSTNTGLGTQNARVVAILYNLEAATGNGNIQCVS